VVRKLQILAATVDVEVIAEQLELIAEHSMCQPGRPSPHGDCQRLARLGVLPEHEIERILLAESTSTRSPARRSSSDLPDSLP
jgi:hypothetical protein